MSISFHAYDAAGNALLSGESFPETACLCAQGASTWDMYLEGSDREELARCANLNCLLCGGTGVEPARTEALELNFSNLNGYALLGLLGLELIAGAATMPEVRRAIMKARATFERRASAFTFEAADLGLLSATAGPQRPRIEHEGKVARIVRGPRVHPGQGLSAERLRERLERFATFVEAAIAGGAVESRWG